MVKCKTLQRGYKYETYFKIIEDILVRMGIFSLKDGMPNPKNPHTSNNFVNQWKKWNLPINVIYNNYSKFN